MTNSYKELNTVVMKKFKMARGEWEALLKEYLPREPEAAEHIYLAELKGTGEGELILAESIQDAIIKLYTSRGFQPARKLRIPDGTLHSVALRYEGAAINIRIVDL